MDATMERANTESRLELYSLLGDGYRAMKEGRESSLEDVEERIQQRRQKRGQNSNH